MTDTPYSPDARQAGIARQIPGGYGGFMLDNGRTTIWLVDPSQVAAAREALLRHHYSSAVARVERKVRWDYAQLYDGYRYLGPHVWRIEGVQWSDLDEAKDRSRYGVLDGASRLQLREPPIRLEVPCYLVAAEISGPIRGGREISPVTADIGVDRGLGTDSLAHVGPIRHRERAAG